MPEPRISDDQLASIIHWQQCNDEEAAALALDLREARERIAWLSAQNDLQPPGAAPMTEWADLSEAEIRTRLSQRGVPGQDARALVNAWFRGDGDQARDAAIRIDELLAR